jgi:hypothetical protein
MGFAVFAVFAFSVVAAGSAFAASNWKVDGTLLTTGQAMNAETEGNLELKVLEGATTVLSTVECSAILDGTITGGSPGKDETLTLLNLEKVAVGNETELKGTPLDCKVIQTAGGALDCKLNELAEVWADNLPWPSTIELMTNGSILDLIGGTGKEPGYEVRCPTPLGNFTELCEGKTSALLENSAGSPGSVLGTLNTESEKANCTVLGSGKGEDLGMGDTWAAPNDLERLTTAVE